VRVCSAGIPLAVSLTGGNRNDVTQLTPLIQAIPPVCGRRERPWQRRVFFKASPFFSSRPATIGALRVQP
jgi:hypothetical protein